MRSLPFLCNCLRFKVAHTLARILNWPVADGCCKLLSGPQAFVSEFAYATRD
jgi:hypothetical protein